MAARAECAAADAKHEATCDALDAAREALPNPPHDNDSYALGFRAGQQCARRVPDSDGTDLPSYLRVMLDIARDNREFSISLDTETAEKIIALIEYNPTAPEPAVAQGCVETLESIRIGVEQAERGESVEFVNPLQRLALDDCEIDAVINAARELGTLNSDARWPQCIRDAVRASLLPYIVATPAPSSPSWSPSDGELEELQQMWIDVDAGDDGNDHYRAIALRSVEMAGGRSAGLTDAQCWAMANAVIAFHERQHVSHTRARYIDAIRAALRGPLAAGGAE